MYRLYRRSGNIRSNPKQKHKQNIFLNFIAVSNESGTVHTALLLFRFCLTSVVKVLLIEQKMVLVANHSVCCLVYLWRSYVYDVIFFNCLAYLIFSFRHSDQIASRLKSRCLCLCCWFDIWINIQYWPQTLTTTNSTNYLDKWTNVGQYFRWYFRWCFWW